MTGPVEQLNVLHLIGSFVIGCAVWDAVKYVFRKLMKLESEAVNDGASRLKPKITKRCDCGLCKMKSAIGGSEAK
jgi:hypothetical protein